MYINNKVLKTKKINVFFNEYNLLMGSGGITYLPLVSGILGANAKKILKIKDNFKFHEFIFNPDTAENIIKNSYKDTPHIACFSISMWNEQLSLKVAKILKEKYNCLIIFGGPSCPHYPTEFFEKYSFIDIAIRAEGEECFNEVLISYLDNAKDYSNIANVAYRDKNSNKCIINFEKSNFSRDLDQYPSPYLSGEYEYLFDNQLDHNYQVIIETNRGCPFLCTYCYWGKGGSSTKYRFHSLERVYAEIDWIAKKKIDYVFNADSNFGMHKRDEEIADYIIQSKLKTGYPQKFRTCWGKNTSEKIFRIAKKMHMHDLDKGITLARQSNSEEALKAVKRDNIKLEAYTALEEKFKNLKIPVYAEMIMGLPCESNESWIDGLCSLLNSVNNQIFVYQAEVYPNTELNEESYRKKYKIKTLKIKLQETHCSPKEQEWLQEYQEIVIGTYTMTKKDWRNRNLFSVVLMVMHSFKASYYLMHYLQEEMHLQYKDFLKFICENTDKKEHPFIYRKIIQNINKWTSNILKGKGRAVFNSKYSDVYIDIEAIIFLEITENLDLFYSELKKVVRSLIGKKKWEKNIKIIDEIFLYQQLRIPTLDLKSKEVLFNYNIAEYMFYYGSKEGKKIKKIKNTIKTVNIKDYKNDYWQFTKEKIIWARKSDKIINEIDYDNQVIQLIQNEEKDKTEFESENKVELFNKLNKFKKYDALDIKNNRRLKV